MTWLELKKYISKMDKSLLNSHIKVYDYCDGSEYPINITELLINDGWTPYLSINEEELTNEDETKETSVN